VLVLTAELDVDDCSAADDADSDDVVNEDVASDEDDDNDADDADGIDADNAACDDESCDAVLGARTFLGDFSFEGDGEGDGTTPDDDDVESIDSAGSELFFFLRCVDELWRRGETPPATESAPALPPFVICGSDAANSADSTRGDVCNGDAGSDRGELDIDLCMIDDTDDDDVATDSAGSGELAVDDELSAA
jgi:hypothetical protein